jgi:vacuolar protein sorting-associated protein 54
MLVEFDKLKRDYQEHQNEIHAKLVAIMADRLAVHCSSLSVFFNPSLDAAKVDGDLP